MDLSEARQTFVTESIELLQEMEGALLRLEGSPGDQETINSLFRSAHTIKGSSGVLGIESVERFTHAVENLLCKVRENEIRIDKKIIEVLFECRDHIQVLVDCASSGAGLSQGLLSREAELVKRLGSCIGGRGDAPDKTTEKETSGAEAGEGRLAATNAWHISIRFNGDLFRNGMDPASFLNYLAGLGETISITPLFERMPAAPEMDPEECYLGLEVDFRSEFDKKTIEDVFEFAREGSVIHILPPHSRVEAYMDMIRSLPEDFLLLGEILIKGGALTQHELDEALDMQKGEDAGAEQHKRLLGEIMVNEGMIYPEVVDAALERQKLSQASRSKEARTMRIDANKLDSLINLVGELVISGANMGQHARRLKDGWLTESASIMSRLVEEIRDNAMRMRMVPIGETFSRFNRVIRDIGRDSGKDIELKISGGETELDKTVIEKINDPLMHLVRNAADHGIEMPEERASKGKAPKGTVRLNAYHDAGSIVIEVSDDGRGLSRERIFKKACALGLLSPAQTPSDSELFRLIFEPGFSTAEQVTKLSGRGVGMDVVKRNIEALRGAVDVESDGRSGTTVRIRLPLTLAIIDGFMVGVGGSSYVIPLDMVVECVEFSEAERRAANRRRYMNLRGEMLPYIRLRDFFGTQGQEARFENIVVVRCAGQKAGFVVDDLYGEVQTVIKPLGRVYRDVKGIAGATITGNGKVALILDAPALMEGAGGGATASNLN
ncbi:MAG: chemotaxis protein CheA [Deltaproteobacteria bacterium]|nr:chemotaxis protein CheA [Deltaproteobacteria bacterium]